jgi:hypothetical protein
MLLISIIDSKINRTAATITASEPITFVRIFMIYTHFFWFYYKIKKKIKKKTGGGL